jgi:chorismate-pyruvate lyase
MEDLITVKVKRNSHVRFGNISSLEKKSNHKLTLFEKIFLINLGSTQYLLEILTECAISIRIVRQEEKNDLIIRDVMMLKKITKQIILIATSSIHKNELTLEVLEEVRNSRKGIGVILLKYNFGFYREIKEIGYNPNTSAVFRKYHILRNKRIVADVEETFLAMRVQGGPGGI